MWVPATLISGVTLSGRYQDFGVSALTSSGGSAMTSGDWSVDPDTGIITLLRSVTLGSVCFTLHDDDGVVGSVLEFPAVNARLTADISDTSTPGNGLHVGTRLDALLEHYQTDDSAVYTEGIYTGTDFDVVAFCDGSSGNNPQNVHLLLELDITLEPDALWTNRRKCTEF